MSSSSQNSQTGKVAFLGFPGSYSDMACRKLFPDRDSLPCSSFEDAFQAVHRQDADLAVIPVDNTLAGRVADVHHLLPEGSLHIIGEHFQPIHHALLGVKGATAETVKYVHSHVHAIPQCRRMIREKDMKSHVHADTASAAAFVADNKDIHHAAIASELAAEIYDLEILLPDIQDAQHNTTRFLIMAREQIIPPYKEGDKVITSFFFRVRNIPAALYKSLGGFATNGINMAKIESYVDEKFQAALFYCDVEGHPESLSFQLALEELNFYASEVNIVGTYPAAEFRNSDT